MGAFFTPPLEVGVGDFCGNAYEGITNLANQGDFVEGIFEAAGSSYAFSTSDRYSHSNYPTKLFNGSKPLSGKIRRSFSNPIDKKKSLFILRNTSIPNKVRTVMNKFSLPGNAKTRPAALFWALAEQLQIIIHEPDSHADVAAAEYQRYLTETADTLSTPFQFLYDGDSYWNQSDRSSIDIPDTSPGETVTVAVTFDARGVEGRYESAWAMINADRDDCFSSGSGSLKAH